MTAEPAPANRDESFPPAPESVPTRPTPPERRRPLLALAAGLIPGILLQDRFSLGYFPWSVGCSLAALIFLLSLRRTLTLRHAGLALVGVALGGWCLALAVHPAPDDISRFSLDDLPLHVRGIVSTFPEYRRFPGREPSPDTAERGYPQLSVTFELSVREVWWERNFSETSGTLEVSCFGEPPRIDYGDEVVLTGRLRDIAPPSNPGQYDWQRQLARRGIHKRLSVPGPSFVRLTDPGKGRGLLDRWLVAPVSRLRWQAHEFLARSLAPREHRVAEALLLGNRHLVSGQQEEQFQRSGTMHLLAVSGLHVFLASFGLLLILWLLGIRGRGKWLLAVAFVLFYGLFVGMRPPVVRSGTVAALYSLAFLFRTRAYASNLLSLAAVVLLLLEPANLFHTGFLLTFTAVITIILGVGAWKRLVDRWREAHPRQPRPRLPRFPLFTRVRRSALHALAQLATVSVSVWLGTAALVACSFHIICFISPLANILLFALVFLTLVLGLVSLPVLGALSTVAPEVAAAGAELLIGSPVRLMLDLIGVLADLPFSYLYVPEFSACWVVLFYAVFLWTTWPGWKWATYRFLSGAPALLAGIVFLLPNLGAPETRSDCRVIFLDVGHGLSIMVEPPRGEPILYDAGSIGYPEIGQNVVAPALWAMGHRRLDRFIISHQDLDHLNGAADILERFEVREVLVAATFGTKPLGREFLREAERLGLPVRRVSADRAEPLTLWHSDRLEILLYSPPGEFLRNPDTIENDRSLTLIIHAGCNLALLTGDAEEAGLEVFLDRCGPRLDAGVTLLQAPHHGGKSSLYGPFLESCAGSVVVISARERFVSSEAVRTYRRHGCEVLETYRVGAVTVTLKQDGLELRLVRQDRAPPF